MMVATFGATMVQGTSAARAGVAADDGLPWDWALSPYAGVGNET